MLLSMAAGRTPDAKEPLFRETVLGASLFRAAWAFRHDRPWLEAQLAFLADHNFTAIRVLGTESVSTTRIQGVHFMEEK